MTNFASNPAAEMFLDEVMAFGAITEADRARLLTPDPSGSGDPSLTEAGKAIFHLICSPQMPPPTARRLDRAARELAADGGTVLAWALAQHAAAFDPPQASTPVAPPPVVDEGTSTLERLQRLASEEPNSAAPPLGQMPPPPAPSAPPPPLAPPASPLATNPADDWDLSDDVFTDQAPPPAAPPPSAPPSGPASMPSAADAASVDGLDSIDDFDFGEGSNDADRVSTGHMPGAFGVPDLPPPSAADMATPGPAGTLEGLSSGPNSDARTAHGEGTSDATAFGDAEADASDDPFPVGGGFFASDSGVGGKKRKRGGGRGRRR